jgi:hypothetical protein
VRPEARPEVRPKAKEKAKVKAKERRESGEKHARGMGFLGMPRQPYKA